MDSSCEQLNREYGHDTEDCFTVTQQQQRCVWENGPIIVGSGPSGLATAACLQEEGIPCVILEKEDCIASLWQQRTYDRLQLHLPKPFCELPLMPFPEEFPSYPTKNQFIHYLESYAHRFNLKPRFNECVESAQYDKVCGMWRISTENRCGEKAEYICRWLIVATGENAEPVIPYIKGMENFNGQIIHASNYKNGAAFHGKKVLVVGCANSGMEISLDLSNHNANPSMVVRNAVHVLPREMFGRSTFGIAIWLMKWLPVWLVDCLLLCVTWFMFGNTDRYGIKRPPMGPLELKNKAGKTPVLDMGAMDRIRNGQIKILPALDCLTPHSAKFINDEEMKFDSVILATGYKSNVPSWLKDCRFFSEDGIPNTPFPNGWKGENGLFAVGFTKRGLLGASIDAMHIAQHIGRLWKKLTERFSFCSREST